MSRPREKKTCVDEEKYHVLPLTCRYSAVCTVGQRTWGTEPEDIVGSGPAHQHQALQCCVGDGPVGVAQEGVEQRLQSSHEKETQGEERITS